VIADSYHVDCYERFIEQMCIIFETNIVVAVFTIIFGHTALTPEDLNEGVKPESHRGGAGKQSDEKHQSRGRGGIPRNLNDSCSRQVLRDLSPLGTRMYAAPEVLSGIKDVIQDIDSSCRRRLKRRKSSTNCTTNYGMVADAYSVGSTIR
jgi:hypothetical protein